MRHFIYCTENPQISESLNVVKKFMCHVPTSVLGGSVNRGHLG